MKTKNNISPETIKAYLAGTLSHAQTHEFEKAMLNDAVLRDMVEGYEIVRDKKVDFQSVSTSLSERLKDRIGEEQKEIYPLWKRVPVYVRAASVLLFLGVGAFILVKNNEIENPENIVTIQPSESKNLPKSAVPVSPKNESATEEKIAISKEEIKTEMAKISERRKEQIAKNDNSKEYKKEANTTSEERVSGGSYVIKEANEKPSNMPEAAEKEVIVVEKPTPKAEPSVAYDTQSSSVVVPAAAPAPVMKREAYSKNKTQATSESKAGMPAVSNIVILNEDSNKPVPNVSIISEDKTLGKTDENGRFNLENSFKGDKLKLVAPDFENTEITINKTNTDFLYIRPKSELIFIDLKRNKTWKYNPSEHPAQPSVSPDEYLDYLQKNLKKPSQAVDKQVVGSVEVEFKVNKKGELSDFKIIKSLGYGCDEEAIRLIREGPKWLPKTYGGNTGRQRVRQVVNF